MKKDEKRLRITDWSKEDRPREKMLSKGIKSLTDAELIAILIRVGTKQKTAVDVAKDILEKVDNDLSTLSTQSIQQLTKTPGIGNTKAITIAAALELGRRRRDITEKQKNKISSSKDLYDYIYPELADQQQELIYCIYLSRSNQVIKHKNVSSGGVSGTITDPKIILKAAVELLASSIILCHNHPSGNIKPSQSDIDLTSKMKDASKLFDISLLDHLIFTNNSYFSFADEGLL